jgi:hypothetical protein
MHSYRFVTSSVFLLVVLATVIAAAPLTQFIREPVYEEGVYARYSTVGTATTSMAALPTFYSFSLAKGWAADVGIVPAVAKSAIDNSTLLRFANTKLRLSYNIGNAVLATVGCKIPTGVNQMSGEQLVTAGNLATRQCNFQYSNLFNSLDLIGGLATSLAFSNVGTGDLSLGFGCAYLYKGPFRPSASIAESFDPGDEVNLSVAAEYTAPVFSRPGSLLADIGYTYFGPDRLGTSEQITAGIKFNWAITARLGAGNSVPYSLHIANYRKGANTNGSRLGETARSANDLMAAAIIPVPFFTGLQPYAKVGVGSYSGGGVYPADSGAVNAVIGTVGIGGSARCTEHLFAFLETGVDAGKMGSERVIGVEVQAGIRLKF